MITPNYYWNEISEIDQKHYEIFNKTLQPYVDPSTKGVYLVSLLNLSDNSASYFGNIADYIALEYGYENTFSWSNWSNFSLEKVHEKSHDFLLKPPIDSTICTNASHKSALRFLGFFNTTGDLQFLTNYLQSSNYKEAKEELQELFLWTLSRVIQHKVDIPSQDLIDWILNNIDEDWFLDYRAQIVGYIGHYSKAILEWVDKYFHSLNKTEQEAILIGSMTVESKTSFYKTVFEKIPRYADNDAINKEHNTYVRIHYINKSTKKYISTLENMHGYLAEKELLSLPIIYSDYYLTEDKIKLFKEILLDSKIVIQARISLFIKILKHRKGHTFFINSLTYSQFTELLQERLIVSEELILPEQYDIEEGLKNIKKYRSKITKSVPEPWYKKWVVV
ncbi:MAG: hypothetical protein ACRBFS_16665 [Aureispira sp.]